MGWQPGVMLFLIGREKQTHDCSELSSRQDSGDPDTYREKLDCLASGRNVRAAFCETEVLVAVIVTVPGSLPCWADWQPLLFSLPW